MNLENNLSISYLIDLAIESQTNDLKEKGITLYTDYPSEDIHLNIDEILFQNQIEKIIVLAKKNIKQEEKWIKVVLEKNVNGAILYITNPGQSWSIEIT